MSQGQNFPSPLIPEQKRELPSVIIVEDNNDVRITLKQICDVLGYKASTASNGAAAIRLAKRETKWTIVIADLHVVNKKGDVENGADIYQRMRGNFRFPSICVIVSGDATAKAATLARGIPGLIGFELKPLDIEVFKSWVEHTGPQWLATVQDAERDPLTGLYNRKEFEKNGQMVLLNARRQETPTSCIYLDLDDFTQVNEDFDHKGGDQVLVAVTRCLQMHSEYVRATDISARVGGDEFVVLLPNTSEQAARKIATRFKKAISSVRVAINNRIAHIRVTAGVATLPAHQIPEARVTDCLWDLVDRSDSKMMKQKKHKRAVDVLQSE